MSQAGMPMHNRNNHTHRRATVLVYSVIVFAVLAGFVSLAVDWARVQLAKTELQTVADSAARYAATGLKNNLNGTSAAAGNAVVVATQNAVDGTVVSLNASEDVELGVWSTSNRTFVVTTDPLAANAVRVTLRRTSARGNPIHLGFASLIGFSSVDLTARATAAIDYDGAGALGENSGAYQYFVPATSNPWLSGTSKGTVANKNNPANNPDYAGDPYTDTGAEKKKDSNGNWVWAANNQAISYSTKKQSSVTAGGISVQPGVSISFDGINGGANNFQSTTLYDGDGNSGWIVSNYKGNENGMSDLKAPINSVVAVFLDDNSPSSGSTPSKLDFSTAESRDFTTLKPALKQPFFIGDGRTSGGEVQRFIPPAGATRLFIGTMDGYEWNNNTGGFVVTAHQRGSVALVQ